MDHIEQNVRGKPAVPLTLLGNNVPLCRRSVETMRGRNATDSPAFSVGAKSALGNSPSFWTREREREREREGGRERERERFDCFTRVIDEHVCFFFFLFFFCFSFDLRPNEGLF